MTITDTDYGSWIGADLTDAAGDKIGKVTQIYVDDQTGQPAWATVKTGLFGSASSFVPLQGTRVQGDRLVSGFDKEKIKGAPSVEEDKDGHLSASEEGTLYRYYGLGGDDPQVIPDRADTVGRDAVGRDTSGPNTDDAMTRSEEELRVGTTTREAGRARLRKYIVTEQVQTTVPVSHEEVRVEREPITDANAGKALDGPDISEEEHEVVLHEERPVVAKETVPKERVRLATETVTEQAQVNESVRKEQIDQESGVERR
jgi:uncharacterized protein (TIGR02271 family)